MSQLLNANHHVVTAPYESSAVMQDNGYSTWTGQHADRGSPTMNVGKEADYARVAGIEVKDYGAGQWPKGFTPGEAIVPAEDLFAELAYEDAVIAEQQGWTWSQLLRHQLKEAHAAQPEDKRYKTAGSDQYIKGNVTEYFREAAAWRFAEDTGMQGIVDADHIHVAGGVKPIIHQLGSSFTPRIERHQPISELVGEDQLAQLPEAARNATVAEEIYPGDVVLVFVPAWPTVFDAIPEGVEVVEVPMGDAGYPSLEMVDAALNAYPQARGAIMGNNPSTKQFPSAEERDVVMGRFLEHARQLKEARIAETGDEERFPDYQRLDFLLIDDDPYGKLQLQEGAPDQQRESNEAQLMREGFLASTRSQSKEFGAPGIRVGWVACMNDRVLQQARNYMSTNGGHVTADYNMVEGTDIFLNNLARAQAQILFGDRYLEWLRQTLRDNVQAVAERVARIDGVKMIQPDGTLYFELDFSGWKDSIFPGELMLDGQPRLIRDAHDTRAVLIESGQFNAVPNQLCYAPGSSHADQDYRYRVNSASELQKVMDVLDTIEQTSQQRITTSSRYDELLPQAQQVWEMQHSPANGAENDRLAG